jgi:hypothetical protein
VRDADLANFAAYFAGLSKAANAGPNALELRKSHSYASFSLYKKLKI